MHFASREQETNPAMAAQTLALFDLEAHRDCDSEEGIASAKQGQ